MRTQKLEHIVATGKIMENETLEGSYNILFLETLPNYPLPCSTLIKDVFLFFKFSSLIHLENIVFFVFFVSNYYSVKEQTFSTKRYIRMLPGHDSS